MLHFKLPCQQDLDALILEYCQKAHHECETVRQQLAQELYLHWKDSGIPFPARPEDYDYWYFVHVQSQDKHVCDKKKKYSFSFSRFQECWVESFSDRDAEKSSDLLEALFHAARDKTEVFNISKPTRHLSRNESDLLLQLAGDEALSALGFSSQRYALIHIPLEIYLLGMDRHIWGHDPIYTHLDGYRIRDDKVLASLFAGNFSSENLPCIDSYFLSFRSNHLISRYAICSIHNPA